MCAAAHSRATSCTVPRLPRSSHMVCIVRTDTVVNAGAVARSGIRGRSTVGLLFDGRRVDCGARRRRVRQRLCGRGESPRVRASSPADIVSGGVLDTGARLLPAKMASGEKTRYIRKVSRYAAALRAVWPVLQVASGTYSKRWHSFHVKSSWANLLWPSMDQVFTATHDARWILSDLLQYCATAPT